MKSLADIFNDTGMTDKASIHSYGRIYEWLLAPWRDKRINLLEVGVSQFGGGCLLAFAEWLENATIYGLDSDLSNCCTPVRWHARINLIKADAYDKLKEVHGMMFTIIIDDAVHLIANQVGLFMRLQKHLTKGGLYIIEDCITHHWLPHFPHLRSMGWRHTLIDMATVEQGDNTMIILERL